MLDSVQPYGLQSARLFSVHGILQARIQEWVAVPSSRGSSQPRDQTPISYIACIGRWVLYPPLATWEVPITHGTLKVKVAQLFPALFDPKDCSPWNSSGQNTGVGSFPFSKGSSQPRDQTQVSHIAGRFFTS